MLAEAALASGTWDLIGFVDAQLGDPLASGVPCLGREDAVHDYPGAVLVLGFGAIAQRQVMVQRIGSGRRWAAVVHPTAYVAPSARLGEGSVVLPHAVVHARADVGPHVIVNSGAVVEHDVAIGAFAQLGPRVVVGGGASIGEAAFIGMAAAVRDHRRIGAGAVVGMGAVVVGDVADGLRVWGVPARHAP